jgi:hypothetical protein
MPSEKVTTQARIFIGYSTEARQRIIRCGRHRQKLHQKSKLLGERFGAKPSGPVGLEHECPLAAEPYRPSPAAHFLDTDGTMSTSSRQSRNVPGRRSRNRF